MRGGMSWDLLGVGRGKVGDDGLMSMMGGLHWFLDTHSAVLCAVHKRGT